MVTGWSKLAVAAPALLIVIVIRSPAAQIATDGTVGPRVQLHGPELAIGAGLGTRAGPNLFHSFDKFSLAAGERATFSGPGAIERIISRVTGGQRSDIDGTIRSTIAGADFYFINPAGILFGPNASLDLQGSFHVSTADELRFADGVTFSATSPAASSFTVAAPAAFGFLGPSSAPILVDQAVLEVPDGTSLSLIGGDLTIRGDPAAATSGGPGSLRAGAGRITLAALGGPGAARPASGVVDVVRSADVSLTDRASVDTSGDGGGTIRIRAGRLVVEKNSSVTAYNTGATDAAVGIDVRAETVSVIGRSRLQAGVFGSGSGGRVSITASDIRIERGFIDSDTQSIGKAGTVTLNAAAIEIGGGSLVSSSSSGEGDAGDVDVTAAGKLEIDEGAVLTNAHGFFGGGVSVGKAGSVTLRARDIVIRTGAVVSNGQGNAGGNVSVTADRKLTLDDEGILQTTTLGEIDAADPKVITGGTVHVRAAVIAISAGSQINSDGFGAGAAGDLVLEAGDRLQVDDSQISTQSLDAGGGRILVRVGKLIELRQSEVSTTVVSDASATAGDLVFDPKLLVLDQSRIIASAHGGTGGNITIDADNILVPGADFEALLARGDISATGGDPTRNGTIVVNAPEVDLAGGLVVLEGAIVDTPRLRAHCGARLDIGASSFTGVGRGGLPAGPDAPLSSAYRGGLATSGGLADATRLPASLEGAVVAAAPCPGAP